MKTLIFLLVTLQALSPMLNAPLAVSDVDAEQEPPHDGVHNHEDPVREGKWNFNYNPGYISVHSVTGDDFSTGHNADIEIKETTPGHSGCPADETITSVCMCGGNSCAKGSVCASGSTCTPPDCKYRYREVQSNCFCRNNLRPDEGHVCTTREVCTSIKGCYSVCEPGKVTGYGDYGCYCKDEKTGGLSLRTCHKGTRCLSDGHCHYDYEVSGVSTQQVTASIQSTLWTNQPYRIFSMPVELINSILFQPMDLVAEATIKLSSPKDATVFLALKEDQDGGLMELLPQLDWKLNDFKDIVYMDLLKPKQLIQRNNQFLTIWYKKIEENKSITFTTNEDGAKFVIFFSTACDEIPKREETSKSYVGANCLCKTGNNDLGARHCKTGQACQYGSCHDLPPKVGRK